MADVVLPFVVRYEGKDADYHQLEAKAVGESVIGAAKLYTAVAHYTMFGFVPRGNYPKEFRCLVQPAEDGSWQHTFGVTTLITNEYALHASVYNKAISAIFGKVVDGIKNIWTRPSEVGSVVETLAEVLKEQGRLNADIQGQLTQGLIKSNDNLASLQDKLITTLPALAEAWRPSGVQLVAPVGNTCREMSQFAGSSNESNISEAEADVIRGDAAMEVDPVAPFTISRIRELHLTTGHCIVDVEGIGQITGKITDPVLETPDNVYARALAEFSGCTMQAKAVRKNGEISRLYISDAKKL